MTTPILLKELLSFLEAYQQKEKAFHAIVGFDGFVDKIQRAVKKKNANGNEYFETIGDFSSHLHALQGKSGQVEIVTKQTKIGGNAPILCNTLAGMGVKSICLGTMGLPKVHPVFKNMHPNACVMSVANPGESDALEFNDGKVILSELSVFENYDWDYVKQKINLKELIKHVKTSQLIAFVDWVNLPHSSSIWDGFLHDVIKPLNRKDFIFLFDLCDPSKKSVHQIDRVLDLISSFSPYGNVTLGLNENETNKIWMALHGHDHTIEPPETSIPSLNEAGLAIYQTMDISALLIHPTDRTILFSKQSTLELAGRVVKEPKVLTGGGDNLNAGYCLGLLLNLEFHQSMLLGMAASGAYIQNGYGADKNDLVMYIRQWASELAGENSK